jgi:hypothetical protein
VDEAPLYAGGAVDGDVSDGGVPLRVLMRGADGRPGGAPHVLGVEEAAVAGDDLVTLSSRQDELILAVEELVHLNFRALELGGAQSGPGYLHGDPSAPVELPKLVGGDALARLL